jgi:FtsP/CotA-like multicopper oxidase with cupredoxin domain
MPAYNGSIPGPTVPADQGSEVPAHVTNDGVAGATVRRHGLRLENRHDGLPRETQEPNPIVAPDADRR